MRLFKAALDTCLDSPFFSSLSVHGLHFTVYAASKSAGLNINLAKNSLEAMKCHSPRPTKQYNDIRRRANKTLVLGEETLCVKSPYPNCETKKLLFKQL